MEHWFIPGHTKRDREVPVCTIHHSATIPVQWNFGKTNPEALLAAELMGRRKVACLHHVEKNYSVIQFFNLAM